MMQEARKSFQQSKQTKLTPTPDVSRVLALALPTAPRRIGEYFESTAHAPLFTEFMKLSSSFYRGNTPPNGDACYTSTWETKLDIA